MSDEKQIDNVKVYNIEDSPIAPTVSYFDPVAPGNTKTIIVTEVEMNEYFSNLLSMHSMLKEVEKTQEKLRYFSVLEVISVFRKFCEGLKDEDVKILEEVTGLGKVNIEEIKKIESDE